MGCDIHAYLEIKNVKWEKLGEPDISRCYNLFAQLANVRNYADLPYIDDPRGLPENTSCDVFGDDCYYHSRSYVTLEELVDFLKQHPKIKINGYVDKKAAEKLKKGILPSRYWRDGNVTGQVWVEWTRENKEIESLIELIEAYVSDNIDKSNVRMVFSFDN